MTSRRLLRAPAAIVLLLLALVTRVALPPGMMPGAGGALMICTGMGPMPSMAPRAMAMAGPMAMHSAMKRAQPAPVHAPAPAKPTPCPFDAAATPPLPQTLAPIPVRLASLTAPAIPARRTVANIATRRLRPPTCTPPSVPSAAPSTLA